MSIFVIGLNHQTAALSLREQAYFPAEKLSLYLQDLRARGIVEEALLLSTCNRSELYGVAEDLEAVKNWFCSQTSAAPGDLMPALYLYRNQEAVLHIMKVACGLDSMVLGEPQIFGQMKSAFSESCTNDAVGPIFQRLFQQIFAVGKEVRTSTAIGACPMSLASASVHFVKKKLPNFAKATVVLIGAGDTMALFMRYLVRELEKPMRIVNRNPEKAQALSKLFSAKVFSFDELEEALSDADIVFSATGSASPIIHHTLIAEIMAKRTTPLTFLDVAIPRDIDPAVSEIANVFLYCLDDLKTIIETNRQGREHAAEKAHELIEERSAQFMLQLKHFDKATDTIRAYRRHIENICQIELRKAHTQLNRGTDSFEVLNHFAYTFMQKLLHTPSVKLRQAGAEGKSELLKLANHLFAIPETEVEVL